MHHLRFRTAGRVLVALGCLWLSGCGSKFSLENFQKLKAGMSEEEVIGLLGKPTETSELMQMRLLVWKNGSDAASVSLLNGKLVARTGLFDGVKVAEVDAGGLDPAKALGLKVNAPPPAPPAAPQAAAPPTEVPPPEPPPAAPDPPARADAAPTPPAPPDADTPRRPAPQPPALPAARKVYPDLFARARAALAAGTTAEGRNIGLFAGDRYRDVPESGVILRGLEVTVGELFGKPIVTSVRPLFLQETGTAVGSLHGAMGARLYRLEGAPGYAVGGITARAGLGIDGLQVTFMAIKGDTLDPSKSYESEWVGGTAGGSEVRIGGDGTPAVGIAGFQQHSGGPRPASEHARGGGVPVGPAAPRGRGAAAPSLPPLSAPPAAPGPGKDRRVFIGLCLVTVPADR
jgi:hypothetical protein